MKRTLTQILAKPMMAVTLAASLALSPVTAAPARADSNTAGAIAAASFLALLMAGAVANAQNRGNVTVETRPRVNAGRGGHGDRDRHPSRERRLDPRKALPNECIVNKHRGRDAGTYYLKTCLVRNFSAWPYLPERCEDTIRLRGQQTRYAFKANCLTRFGYYPEGRGRSARR